MPIVRAIEQYQADHEGVAPAELDELIPEYLEKFPALPAALPDQYSYMVYSDGQWTMTTASPIDFGYDRWHYDAQGRFWMRYD